MQVKTLNLLSVFLSVCVAAFRNICVVHNQIDINEAEKLNEPPQPPQTFVDQSAAVADNLSARRRGHIVALNYICGIIHAVNDLAILCCPTNNLCLSEVSRIRV